MPKPSPAYVNPFTGSYLVTKTAMNYDTLYCLALLLTVYFLIHLLSVNTKRSSSSEDSSGDDSSPDGQSSKHKTRPLLLHGNRVEFVPKPSGRIEVRVYSPDAMYYVHNDGSTRSWSLMPSCNELFPSHDAAVQAVKALNALEPYTPHV